MTRPGKKKPKKKSSMTKAPDVAVNDANTNIAIGYSSAGGSLSIVPESPSSSSSPTEQNFLLSGFIIDAAAMCSFTEGLNSVIQNASLISQSMQDLQHDLLDHELRDIVLPVLITVPTFVETIFKSVRRCVSITAKLFSLEFSDEHGFPIATDEFINDTPMPPLQLNNTDIANKCRRRHSTKSGGGAPPIQIQQDRVGPMAAAMNVSICVLTAMHERIAELVAALEPEELRDWGGQAKALLKITEEAYTLAEELLLRRGIRGDSDGVVPAKSLEKEEEDNLDEVLNEFRVSDLMTVFKTKREAHKACNINF